VTVVFLGIVVIGLLMLLSTLAVSHLLGKKDREGPPFRLLAQGTGLMGVGVAGLIATWLGLSDFGLAMTALVTVVVALGILYGFVMPYLRKRQSESSADDPTRPSDGFTV
jgi:multisubunit Na+/H+ antiporter MnhB subunit